MWPKITRVHRHTRMAKIGFIGLGLMGRPMALNLIKAGHALCVYARRTEAMVPLLDAGATGCASPAEVAQQTDIVITMVSDTPDVEAVLFGDHGVAEGIRPGAIVVDMSTISPTATRAFAVRLRDLGAEMLDAPVSGGDIGAINATLSIMVGGPEAVFEQIQPIFAAMGKNIVRIGENGAGQVAKACNQIVAAVAIEGVAEALLFARKNDVDPARVREALMGGFAGSRILEVHGQRMLDHDYRPGFKTRLHQKDMHIVMQVAHELGLSLPAADLVMQRLDALVDSGDGELDSAALMKVIERGSAG